MSEWKKGSTTSGKYPEKAFAAVLKAIYPGVVGKEDTPALKLDFEGDLNLAIFGIDQIKDDGTIEGFKDLGKFLDSLATLKVEYFWGLEGNEIMGFKTEPDLIGCKLFLKPTERLGDVGSKWEGQIFRTWTLEKYEKVTSSPTATTTTTTKPKTTAAPELMDTILDTIKQPMSASELYNFFNKKFKVSELKTTLAALETDGLIKKEGDKYQVI